MTVTDGRSDIVARQYLSGPVDHLANLPWPFPDDLAEFR
ncbi:DUF3445 domain-containing protein, partial [Streptomyces sp. SID10244]|nr:DUF3445 domain-containing protein [Streptomyces sp. SID10244]